MERHEVLDLMRALRLSGMRAAFDEIVAQAIKRQHPIQRVLGDLLKAEIADKKARSIGRAVSPRHWAGTPGPTRRPPGTAGSMCATLRSSGRTGAGRPGPTGKSRHWTPRLPG